MERKIVIFKSILFKDIYKWSRNFSDSHLIRFSYSSSLSDDIVLHLSTLGWEAIPSLKRDRSLSEKYLREYLEVVGQFAEWNAQNIFWWATNFSSKNRFNNPITPLLQEWSECIHAIDSCPDESPLVFIDISWEVIVGLKSIAQNHGWELSIFASPLNHFRYRICGKFHFWKIFLGEIRLALTSIWIARATFGRVRVSNLSKKSHYLIKSFAYSRNFQLKSKYTDPFFGLFPSYIENSLKQAITVALALSFHEKKKCYALMKELPCHVHPLESYLHYSDVIFWAFHWLHFFIFNSFKVKGKIKFFGLEVTAFFREFVRCGGLKISFFQFLQFEVGKRLGKIHNIKTCWMTYEGRPWERFFIAGLRDTLPNIDIIGCQHTVIPMSATDMFLHQKEQKWIPLPDKIITTGIITKNILNKYSAYPKEKIIEGCALRYEEIQNYSLLPRKINSENREQKFMLLVAFGGDDELELFNYTLGQAEENPDVRFCMRHHPKLSFEQLLRLSLWKNKELPENLENSKSLSVIKDLQICDAVLYWGTTVSLEALMMGKPIIQFDRGDFLSYDPLFEFNNFKWQVCKGSSIKNALQEIKEMPESKFQKLQIKGRQYIKDYFYPVTPDNLLSFLPISDC
ncbi:hypothetical protein OAJ61_00450 [bacterium]|nr:hypothetical protein [bacterium]